MNNKRQRGFSLLEMAVALAVLTIIVAVVTEALMTMQARNVVESGKVDLTQQSREFMDQIVNDIHQTGFPSIKLFDPSTLASPTNCSLDANVACGLVSAGPNALQFEGDVDGSGVSEVFIQEVPSGGPCPCTIERGTVPKSTYIANPNAQPPYYTEVTNVMNTSIFTAYESDGSLVSPWPISSVMQDIADIQITLYVKSTQADPKTNQYPTVTMVAAAKITNWNSL